MSESKTVILYFNNISQNNFFLPYFNQNAVLVRYFSKTKKCMDPKHVTVFAQSIDLSEAEVLD